MNFYIDILDVANNPEHPYTQYADLFPREYFGPEGFGISLHNMSEYITLHTCRCNNECAGGILFN